MKSTTELQDNPQFIIQQSNMKRNKVDLVLIIALSIPSNQFSCFASNDAVPMPPIKPFPARVHIITLFGSPQ